MEIIKTVIKKHKGFLGEYTKEFEELDSNIGDRDFAIKRTLVLREKSDQLENWIAGKEQSTVKKYVEEKKAADSEIKHLEEKLAKIDSKGNANDRHQWLKKRISSHKKALAWWETEYNRMLPKMKAKAAVSGKASKEKPAGNLKAAPGKASAKKGVGTENPAEKKEAPKAKAPVAKKAKPDGKTKAKGAASKTGAISISAISICAEAQMIPQNCPAISRKTKKKKSGKFPKEILSVS